LIRVMVMLRTLWPR